MSATQTSVIQSLNTNINNLQDSTRQRGNKSVTIGELKKLDNLALTLTSNVQHSLHIMLGKAIVESDFNIDKNAMDYTIDKPNGKTSNIGLQKRQGVIQSALLRLKNNSHHLKNVGFLANLLPVGTTNATTKIFSTCINKFWHIFHNQMAFRDDNNIYDFCQMVANYLSKNNKIDGETEILLYQMGNRFYSDGNKGVNIRKIKFSKWLELWLKMADSRKKMALNSEIVKETSQRKTEERKQANENAKIENDKLAKWTYKLVELAMIESTDLETLKQAILQGNKDFNIIDTTTQKLAV